MPTTVDRRREREPVWRFTPDQFSWANGETVAVEANLTINGVVRAMVGTVSDNTNNRTVTVLIKDSAGGTLYTTGALSENATTAKTGVNTYVDGRCTLSASPSDDPGASGVTLDLILYGD